MPARSPARQPAEPGPRSPGALDWFDSTAGQALLGAEVGAVERMLAGCPALPWLWIGVRAAPLPSTGRGLVLHRRDDGFGGPIRCRLPLPLASESLGAVLLQHALDDAGKADELLDECARVLTPGGALWLAALNPWTPYRARWAGAGLRARDPASWQSTLRRAGFSRVAISVQWLGPHWRTAPGSGVEAGVGATDRLRAGLAFTANKRVRALIPPAPLRKLRWQAS
jgi:hypothetical protein